jgi:heptosyltransferase-3
MSEQREALLRTPPRHILVIYVTRIGDTMLLTPLVRSLAKAWPSASIDFLGSRTSAEVFLNLPFVHHVGSLKKKWVPFQGWLSKRIYDLAIVAGNNNGDKLFVEYAKRMAHHVIAFRQASDSLNSRLLAVVEKPAFQSCHAVDYLLALLAPLGIQPDGRHLSYQVSEAEQAWAKQELISLRTHSNIPLIGLQIASFPTKDYRDWPVQHFIELCQRIRVDHPSAHFLIFGGKLEWKRTLALHTALLDCSTHYAGNLSLRQTAALMNELDLYVGVDTGPSHIMGALHRPMVAMYHGSSPSTLLAPLEHPCLWTVNHPRAGQGFDPNDYSMAEISVDTVLAKVREALA